MSEAVFIFTIAGVQPFIGQARRLSDLVAGSRLVARLAGAAAQAIRASGGTLVFPSQVSERMPNRLVATAPLEAAGALGEAARRALEDEFRRRAEVVRERLSRDGPAPDRVWEEIWERQLAAHWETFWAAASIGDGGYPQAYQEASRALAGCKRTRAFAQAVEDGLKDSLSGSRSALRTAATGDARGYWRQVARRHAPSRLKPEGRERLDALGALKRFGDLAEKIPSVSSIAAADFLAEATDRRILQPYREAVERLLGGALYRVSDDTYWPYDGDLLYQETLAPGRLRDSYGLESVDEAARQAALQALRALQREAGGPPSPYYAVMVLDGDNMGSRIADCPTREAHQELSRRVGAFADGVKGIVENRRMHGHLVYAGGDDVLALAPLSTALPLAMELAGAFAAETGGTASAGVAVVHHLYPLDAALAAAHDAEDAAKKVEGKGSVGVQVIKRSGERVGLLSPWAPLREHWGRLVGWFRTEALSSRFAHEAARSAGVLGEAPELFRAELRRLVRRHRAPGVAEPGDDAADLLAAWSSRLPEGATGLAGWLLLARFVAKGGGE